MVPSDSQIAMTANYKVLYGVKAKYTVPDKTAQYEHATNTLCFTYPLPLLSPEKVCFNGANGGYYLNDASTAPTTATCCPAVDTRA